MSTLTQHRRELAEKLARTPDADLIEEYGEPVRVYVTKQKTPTLIMDRIGAWITRPPQTPEGNSSNRVDHYLSLIPETGTLVHIFRGPPATGLKKLSQQDFQGKPLIDLLVCGFDTLRAFQIGGGNHARIIDRLEATLASLVLAAKSENALRKIAENAHLPASSPPQEQVRIAATSKYKPILDERLCEAFGENHSIHIEPSDGSTEMMTALDPRLSIIFDLANSGTSLRDNGYEYVLPIKESPIVTIVNGDTFDLDRDEALKIRRVSHSLAEASRKTFTGERHAFLGKSGKIPLETLRNADKLAKSIIPIEWFLEARTPHAH